MIGQFRKFLLASLLAIVCATASGKDAPRSFSLSTARTFAPGESVKIQLMARNVPEFEFRVYKVRDPEKFFANLRDLHSFGEQSYAPPENVDQRTLLERIHDWKNHLWWRMRHFFHWQFTEEAIDSFREQQGKLAKKSKVVGAAQFAQIPLLNSSQLVARWKLQTPPALVSETQQLPIDNLGSGVYLIEATDGAYKAYTVAIVTPLALIERGRPQSASVYVADRKSGEPVAGAAVALWQGSKQQSSGKTDSNGLATLDFKIRGGSSGSEPENVWVVARRGDDFAIVTPYGYRFVGESENEETAYVYTDRPVYRPGHMVHIKGVIRRLEKDTVQLPQTRTVKLTVTAGGDQKVFEKDLAVSSHGTVSADFTLEKDAPLGYYWVRLGPAENDSTGYSGFGGGNFEVQEYKKPEYQVTVKPAVQRILQGNSLQATIEARYFFGEPVPGAKVKYSVYTSEHWWYDQDQGDDNSSPDENAAAAEQDYTPYDSSEQQVHDGVLDANGRLTINVPVGVDAKHRDEDVRIEARVTDAGNREVSGHGTVLATYGSFRLSVEPVSYVFQSGQTPRVKITARTYDDKPVQTAVHLDAALRNWDASSRKLTTKSVAARDVNTGADGIALVDLPMPGSGDFEITATASTPESRTVEGRTWIWIWNGAGEFYNANTQMQLVADQKSYKVGDTAHMLLVTGIKNSWAAVAVEGNSIQSQRVLHSDGESIAFDVPITTQSQPNVIVTALLVHDNQLYTAQKSLKVPVVERTLTITATPSKPRFTPGERASFDVFAADSTGHPVQAELSFGEVDEAIYAVRPDTSGNILDQFYRPRNVYLQPDTSFEFFFSGRAGTKSPMLAELNAGLFHPRMAQVKPGSDLVMPKVRKAFPDTAFWNPSVQTGADGHARVDFNFPDSLTTWRTTIRAMTDDGKAGQMITRVLVRKNLIVRLAAPRFFRQSDEAVLRVIAHNYLETAKEVTFNLNVQGVDVLNGQPQKVNVAPKTESYVDWRVRARNVGSAVLTASALTNEESDALEMTVPVHAYGVKQQEAASGVVYSGTGQNQWTYAFPANSDPAAHGLAISISPSVAGSVFDGLAYLTSYPWGCTEQTMSSFLPDLLVADALDRLHLKSPVDRAILNDMVSAGLERLASYQHDDGGWGWWPDDPSRVFMTAYVVSGVAQAREAGRNTPPVNIWSGREWLIKALKAHPNMQPDLRAYVLYALAVSGGNGEKPTADLDKAWSDRGRLTDEGLALLGLALDAAGDSRAHEAALQLEKKAVASDNEAHWSGTYDGLLDYSTDTSAEATAFALKLMVRQDRQSGLLSKSARWLAQHRQGEYWYNTKQTAMVIAGLTDYLAVSGELSNESDVEVLVNGTSVGKHHFSRTDALASPWRLDIPAQQLAGGGQVTIRKSGNGLTYWSVENSWFSTDKRQFQKEQLALNIVRDYYILRKRQDNPAAPVTYDLAPLQGPVHIGDVLAVKLAVGGTPWSYLLAEDPIPAGTEFIANSSLYKLNNKPDWWADWYTRKEFHDDRAGFFNTEFDKRREYVYLLKVVNAGKFQVSPAAAAPMYQPATQATTDPATLEVLP